MTKSAAEAKIDEVVREVADIPDVQGLNKYDVIYMCWKVLHWDRARILEEAGKKIYLDGECKSVEWEDLIRIVNEEGK